MKIGVLIPSTSKGRNWKNIQESYLYNLTIKTFLETCDLDHHYVFYIGYDSDDPIYSNPLQQNILNTFIHNFIKNFNLQNDQIKIDLKFINMDGIQKGHLTKMWNKLFKNAFDENCDYFFQCGDDIQFITKGWINHCIGFLKGTRQIGVVGPINENVRILTQSFVSRKHYEIFQYYFPEEIHNWFCDDWINEVYGNKFKKTLTKHKCFNLGGDPRYSIKASSEVRTLCSSLVKRDQEKIKKYILQLKRK